MSDSSGGGRFTPEQKEALLQRVRDARLVPRIVEQAQAKPDCEVVVSEHQSLGSARARVYQMRQTKKWGSAPLSLRAEEVDDGAGGVVAAVLAKFAPAAPEVPDGRSQLPPVVTAVDGSRLSEEEKEDLLLEFMNAMYAGRAWVVPARLVVRYRESRKSD